MNNNEALHPTKMSFKRKTLVSAIAFAYLNVAMVPVYASDTEIYAQALQTTTSSPTLMMMFDTSGSMAECTSSTSSCAAGSQRIDALKSSMRKILRGDITTTPQVKAAPGFIKMGVSRYRSDGGGGWVTYPARPLDAFVGINTDGFIEATGASGDADAEQGSSQVLNNNQLTFGLNGATNNQAVGMQFANVRVPKDAVISEAYIEVTANGSDSGASTWEITAQAAGDAADYAASTISSRTYGSAYITYQPPAWASGTKYQIPVTAVLQQVVKRSDWCGGNAVSLRIRDIGTAPTTRRAYSYEGAGSTASLKPKLVVNYLVDPASTTSCIKNVPRTTVFTITNKLDDAEWSTATTGTDMDNNNSNLAFNSVVSLSPLKKNVVGYRFQNIGIPAGATITSASLQVTSYPNSSTTDKSYSNVQTTNVKGFLQSNLPAFCSNSSTCVNNATVNGYATTTATTLWAPPSNYMTQKTAYLIDVTSQMQEIIGQAGWTSGNALGFRLLNNGSTSSGASFYSLDGSSSLYTSLLVNWVEPVVTNLSTLTTVRDEIEGAVNSLNATGATPLAAAYAEASRYMYGMAPSTQGQYDSRTVDTTPKFISPVDPTDQCSGNYIFLLTDGDPNGLAGADTNTQGITGRSCSSDTGLNLNTYITGTSDTTDWRCMFDLARYNASNSNRVQNKIRTNTVIFGPLGGDSEANMKQVANFGEGKYFKAGDEAALVNAITSTITDLLEMSGTVAAPGVAVNQVNRLSHLDQLFYAVFEPKAQAYHWEGNLKRYRLGTTGSQIADVNNADAIDPSTGFFKENSRSFWSPSTDGSKAVEGGAASMLPTPPNRKMYTFMGALSSKNVSLTTIDTTNTTFNTAAKSAMGISDDNIYKNLMNWYKGYLIPSLYNGLVTIDSNTLVRNRIGSALHSQPVLVNYGYTGALTDAANPDNQKNYVFFSTMEGTLHAVDAKTGIEKFSFIPGEKLDELKSHFDNPSTAVPEFGMDLTWTYFRKDSDGNGQVTSGSGDKIYLYGGMRMGGNNYYALDVTNLDSPSLLFAIQGGSTGFENMGQTWSQPVVATVSVGGTPTTVLIFGGGYDTRHENANQVFTGNDKGNQLYIVNAFTGDLIWSASGNGGDNPKKTVSEMNYSVVSQPKVIDVDGDSIADSIYFGDLGGQVFRVDLDKKGSGASLAKRVRLIAKLGQTGTASATTLDQRRFYEAPEVALFKDSSNKVFATVALGSGYRSHPLNTLTQDRFFVLFDYDVPRPNLSTLAESDSSLQAVLTPSLLAQLSLSSNAGVSATGTKGWYIDLPESGEKSMATGLIYLSRLIFTTYVPGSVATATSCTPVIGRTKMYTMCMPYGDVCGTITNRVRDNVMIGMAGESQLLITKNGTGATATWTKKLLTGTDGKGGSGLPSGGTTPTLKATQKWREKTRNPAN